MVRLSLTFVLVFLVCISNSQASDNNIQNEFQFTPETRGKVFTIQGSNTVGANLMRNFLVDFLTMHNAVAVETINLPTANEYRVQGYINNEKVYVDVAAHGSSTGFKGLAQGTADIAMASRRIKDSEVKSLEFLGNLRKFTNEHIVAIDGLAVIVNQDNPISELRLDQIAEIFSGQISNWKQLGGYDQPISLYARDNNSGTWDTFESLVLDEQHVLSPKARRFESNDELSDLVSGDIAGIGFVGLASVRKAKALAISEPGANSLKPEVLVVATEDYALSRRLYLYTPENLTNDWIRQFLRYVQSDRAQSIVAQTGFVAQTVFNVPANFSAIDTESLEDYVRLLQDAHRLSINIRFAEGSADLDNKARHDVNRIVSFMQKPENIGKRLVLIGFGDPLKTERRTDLLSQMRAIKVKSALLKQGVPSERVYGFGSDKPVAADDGDNKAKNRRVEIWMR